MIRRVPRFSYFLNAFIFSIPLLIVALVAGFLIRYEYQTWQAYALVAAMTVAVIANIWLNIQNTIGRLHDIGKQASYALWLLVPIVSIYWGFVLLFKAGDKKENRYGPPSDYDEQNYTLKIIAFLASVALVGAVISILPTSQRFLEDDVHEDFKQYSDVETRDHTKEVHDTKKLTSMISDSIEQNAKEKCNAEVSYNIGKSLLKNKMYDSVELLSNTYTENCGEFLELRWLAYNAAKKQGDFLQAKRLVTALIQDYPDDKDYYGWRGLLFEEYNYLDKAILDFEQVVKLRPSIRRIPLNLADLYRRKKMHCDTHRVLETYFNRYPDSNQGRWASMKRQAEENCSNVKQTH